MGIRRYVVGIKSQQDEKFKKMFSVWRACKDADIDVPNEVEEFFGEYGPSDKGVYVDIDDAMIDVPSSDSGLFDDSWDNIQDIIIADLPKDVNVIRIYEA